MRAMRVAAHVHSNWSDDGSWSLPDIARAFSRRGYDAVMLSEHDRGFTEARWQQYRRACHAISRRGLLLIPGIEYQDGDNVVHIPVWGVDVPFLGENRPTLELLRDPAGLRAVRVFAHPLRRDAIARFDATWTPLLTAVEVWNRRYDGIAPARRVVRLAQKEGLTPFASLDFHTRRQFFPLAMSVTVDGPPSIEAVIDALLAGRGRPIALRAPALVFAEGGAGVLAGALENMRRRAARRARALSAALARKGSE